MRISDWSSDVCSSDLPTNTALIVNAGSAKTKGVELDGFVRYEGFQFNYGLALFDGDIDLKPQPGLEGLLTTPHKFARAPEASFPLGGHYEYPDPVLGGPLTYALNSYWPDNYNYGLARFHFYNF